MRPMVPAKIAPPCSLREGLGDGKEISVGVIEPPVEGGLFPVSE